MFVHAILTATALRLVGQIDFLGTANTYIVPSPILPLEIGNMTAQLSYEGTTTVRCTEGGSMERTWSMGIHLYQTLNVEQPHRVDQITHEMLRRMNRVVRVLHLWYPTVYACTFTQTGAASNRKILPRDSVVATGTANVLSVELTSGDWSLGTATGTLYTDAALSAAALTIGGVRVGTVTVASAAKEAVIEGIRLLSESKPQVADAQSESNARTFLVTQTYEVVSFNRRGDI